MAIRLSGKEEFSVYGVMGGLFFTGLFWMIAHRLGTSPDAFVPAVQPAEKIWLRLHGAFAMLTLVLLGYLIPVHAREAWRAGRNRLSGSVFLLVNLCLALSGYGLYYLGGEVSREFVHDVHIWVGLFFPVIFVTHVVCGKKLARKNRPKLNT